MESVVEGLKDRRESADDLVVKAMVDEVLENQDSIMREVEEPTLKHGTDTVVYDDIVSEGLVPGEENRSQIGEQGEYESVCFSTSFPVALRYGELTGVNLQRSREGSSVENLGSLECPMVVETPVSELDELNVDSREESAVNSVLGTEVKERAISPLISYLEGSELEEFPMYSGQDHLLGQAVDGDQSSGEVAKALLGDSFADQELLQEYGVFEELSHDEVNADYIKEVRAPYAPVNEKTNIYVPANKVDHFRDRSSEQGFEGNIHSIEARSLLHEERMKDVYGDRGTIRYEHPSDTGMDVSFFLHEGLDEHDGSPDVVDISRLRGEPVYGSKSN